MLATTSQSRKRGQFQSRLLRVYRPVAEGLEDRLVLSRVEILSQSASAEYSLLMSGGILGTLQSSGSTSEIPGGVGAGGNSDGLASASVDGGLAAFDPSSFGLAVRAYASVANGHWGFTEKKLTAAATGQMTAKIVPDAGERIGDTVQVVVSFIGVTEVGTGSLSFSAGGLTQSGTYLAKIGDTIDLSMSASARAEGGEPIEYFSDYAARIGVSVLTQPTSLVETTTTLTSSSATSRFGESVTFTAEVETASTSAGVPTGSVDFSADGMLLGSVVLNGGIATCPVADLPADDYTITASYLGDGSFEGSDAAPLPHSVEKARADIDLIVLNSPSVYGEVVTLGAILSTTTPALVEPGGTITLLDGPNPIQGFPITIWGSTSFVVSFEIATLSAGIHRLSAVYGGDNNYEADSSLIATHNVARAPLIVSADDQIMVRGGAVPPLTYTITGFVLGEDESVVRGKPDLDTTATPSSPAGRYPIAIAIGTLAADNYQFPSLRPGTLAVQPTVVDIRVEWGGRSMSIAGMSRDLPFLDIKAIDVVFSDDVILDSNDFSLASNANSGKSYAFNTYVYDPATRTARWTLQKALEADGLMLALDGHDGVQLFGFPDIDLAPFSLGFSVLPGDFNGDRVVNSQDLVGIRNQMLGFDATTADVWADLDGNGVVDIND